MLPPDNLMICLEILSPMPLPPSLVVKNGIKICSAISGEMVGPLFLTSIIISSSSLHQARRNTCPSVCSPIACVAFFNKLITTCEIRLKDKIGRCYFTVERYIPSRVLMPGKFCHTVDKGFYIEERRFRCGYSCETPVRFDE